MLHIVLVTNVPHTTIDFFGNKFSHLGNLKRKLIKQKHFVAYTYLVF